MRQRLSSYHRQNASVQVAAANQSRIYYFESTMQQSYSAAICYDLCSSLRCSSLCVAVAADAAAAAVDDVDVVADASAPLGLCCLGMPMGNLELVLQPVGLEHPEA